MKEEFPAGAQKCTNAAIVNQRIPTLLNVNEHKFTLALVLAAALAGCGGGGGGTTGSTGSASVSTSVQAEGSSGAVINTSDPALPNNVLDSTGAFDATAYKATAAMIGKEGGIAYRYGPSSAEYGNADKLNNLPTRGQRSDTAFLPRGGGGERPCIQPNCGTWQVGTYSSTVGDFSSNIGNVAFMPDSPTQRVGVSTLAISSISNQVISQKPELSWVYYGNGLDEINAVEYKRAGNDTTNPVAVARCYGRPGWCVNGLMVFQNGLIASTQSNTSPNKATTQLAAGKVPTAIAISNSNEFAFVTVWDTVNLRGEIAVVALASLCSNGRCPDNHGEWTDIAPGLPNLGNTAYMKVLGYVPLPSDMKAPTEISVTTGVSRSAYLAAGVPGQDSYASLSPLSDPAKRARFQAGGSAFNTYAKTGVAVVVSKSEQKVAFIDLKPLFQYYQTMYFGTSADNAVTTTVGAADNQWPRTFSAASQQMPTVIKTMSLPSRPTAVRAYQWGANKRAWVATQDGKLRIFNLGDFPSTGTGSAASIVEGGSVDVGVNPTGITYAKEKGGRTIYPDHTQEVLVTSRGMRQVSWVRFSADGNGASVIRTLNDTRLKDPISAEDTDNHGDESYVVSIADYNGRALHNYRYGPIILNNNGGARYDMLSDDKGSRDFEYGGAYPLPGKAFHISSANIP